MSYLIGITGGSGSGKSEFLKKVRERFNETQVCLLSQDNYYWPREDQTVDPSGYVNFDKVEALDIMRFARDLEQLKRGEGISFLEYTFNNQPSARLIELASAPVVITEGTFVLHSPEIFGQLDLKLFIDADIETMYQRRLKRDLQERGYDEAETRFRFEAHFLPCYHQYIAPCRDKADVVVPNFTTFGKAFDEISLLIERQLEG